MNQELIPTPNDLAETRHERLEPQAQDLLRRIGIFLGTHWFVGSGALFFEAQNVPGDVQKHVIRELKRNGWHARYSVWFGNFRLEHIGEIHAN